MSGLLSRLGRGAIGALKSYGVGIGIFAAVTAMLLAGIGTAERTREREQLRMLEGSIRRAAVACYALEGAYPESVAYMTEHYGLRYDESRFYVHYQAAASNWMPDFFIIDLRGNT